jgi:hypothetical protein
MPQSLRVRYRHTIIIGLLIGTVCCLTLTPTMYLLFHALRWTRAQQALEGAFLPLLLLFAIAYLCAYQRAKVQSRFLHQTTSPAEEQTKHTPN